MTFGAEFTNAGGVARLTPTDFVDRLVTQGSLSLTYVNPSTLQYEATISVPGIANNGQWAVSVFGFDCRAVIQSGAVKFVSPAPNGTYKYAVFRR